MNLISASLFNPTREYLVLNDDILADDLSGESTGQIKYESNGIRFTGNSNGKTLHVLPVVFSNCLKSENGNLLVRVNLLLTGIVFTGQASDRISYSGPPFSNDCLKKIFWMLADSTYVIGSMLTLSMRTKPVLIAFWLRPGTDPVNC